MNNVTTKTCVINVTFLIIKVDLSENLAHPEDFVYLLLEDSECLVNFLEHFESVSN